MNILIDTHLILWLAVQPEKLSPKAVALIDNPANHLIFSAASIWEIAIKRSLGRPDFTVDPGVMRRALIDNGYTELPIDSRHALATQSLPALHKDPFDRIIIAQAIVEGMALATSDDTLARYPGTIISV